MLTAHRLDAAGIKPEHVFTFGAPRVGDAAFTSAYRPLLFCFEAAHDPVPGLPPLLDYEPVRDRYLLAQNGQIYRTDGSWTDHLVVLSQVIGGPVAQRALDCHSIDHYLEQLGG